MSQNISSEIKQVENPEDSSSKIAARYQDLWNKVRATKVHRHRDFDIFDDDDGEDDEFAFI